MKNTAETRKSNGRRVASSGTEDNESGVKRHPKQREKDLQASVVQAVEILSARAVDPSPHRIQLMDKRELGMLQAILGHGETPGRWQTPAKWAGGRQPGMRDIDLRELIVANLEERHLATVREADEALAARQQATDARRAQWPPTASLRVHALVDGAVVAATRYLLLCRVAPAGMANAKGRPLDTTTIMTIAYQYLPLLLAVAVGKRLDNDLADTHINDLSAQAFGSYLSLVQPEDLERFNETVRRYLTYEVKRARMLAEMGLWMDVPVWETPFGQVTAVKGVAKRRQALPKPVDKHLPLPDDYVAEMGRKSLWIIQELGPNLFTIGEKIVEIWQSTDDPAETKQSVASRRSGALLKYLQNYVWHDSQGTQFAKPPFDMKLSQVGRGNDRGAQESPQLEEADAVLNNEDSAEDAATLTEILSEQLDLLQWPPRGFAQIIGLMGLLQCAHLFVVAMSTAARKMELLSIERGCVLRARDGTPFARGRTFKLVERHEGELRDWVLPDVAADAIEQQTRLASLMELIGPQEPDRTPNNQPVPPPPRGTHLWVQTGIGRYSARSKPLEYVRNALITYARALDMSVTPGGQGMRTHRFRKTVARLGALALTDAPMILMQVFGHKSVEMTLYYILTDKDLQVEVEQIRRELKIMRGVTMVENMAAVAMAQVAQEAQEATDNAKGSHTLGATSNGATGLRYGGYGGAAAPKLFGAVRERVIKVYRTGREWGASDSYETAYFLTEAGLTFTMPRDGVFCTKAFTQPAACTGKRGKTDPGNCQPDCGHRLELMARRAQLETSLHKQVNLYEEALKEGHELLWKGLAKKIRDTLKPFDDLREKWMQHPTVRQLVEAAGETAP